MFSGWGYRFNHFLISPLIPLCGLEPAHARHSLSKLNSALAYSQISHFCFIEFLSTREHGVTEGLEILAIRYLWNKANSFVFFLRELIKGQGPRVHRTIKSLRRKFRSISFNPLIILTFNRGFATLTSNPWLRLTSCPATINRRPVAINRTAGARTIRLCSRLRSGW